jgi:hypothetical protein
VYKDPISGENFVSITYVDRHDHCYFTDVNGNAIPAEDWNAMYVVYARQKNLEETRAKFGVNAVPEFLDSNSSRPELIEDITLEDGSATRHIVKVNGQWGILVPSANGDFHLFIQTENPEVFVHYKRSPGEADFTAVEFFPAQRLQPNSRITETPETRATQKAYRRLTELRQKELPQN